MEILYLIFSGVLIGAGAVLPGISGSVIAIMLGIYEKIINTLVNKEKNILSKFIEILPVAVGLIIGVIIFGNFLFILFEKYEIQLRYSFIGLILGSVPILNNEIKKKQNENIKLKYFFLTFISSLILLILPKLFNISFNSNISTLKLIIAGILYASGKIIPGISSSFFLMVLDLYDYLLLFFSNPITFILKYSLPLIPFFIGILLGVLILVKVINYLLSNHFTETYSGIMGFVLGSILSIFPGFELRYKYIISIILMFISFSIVYKFSIDKNK